MCTCGKSLKFRTTQTPSGEEQKPVLGTPETGKKREVKGVQIFLLESKGWGGKLRPGGVGNCRGDVTGNPGQGGGGKKRDGTSFVLLGGQKLSEWESQRNA